MSGVNVVFDHSPTLHRSFKVLLVDAVTSFAQVFTQSPWSLLFHWYRLMLLWVVECEIIHNSRLQSFDSRWFCHTYCPRNQEWTSILQYRTHCTAGDLSREQFFCVCVYHIYLISSSIVCEFCNKMLHWKKAHNASTVQNLPSTKLKTKTELEGD